MTSRVEKMAPACVLWGRSLLLLLFLLCVPSPLRLGGFGLLDNRTQMRFMQTESKQRSS